MGPRLGLWKCSSHGARPTLACRAFLWTRLRLGTIAQLRHAFLFGAMSTAKDRAVFFNPVADYVRATMRASRCEGLNCTFKAVKGVGAAV